MQKNTKYYFGFRQTIPHPPGKWVLCGPYDTNDEAKSERQASKASDCQVTVPFLATTEEEAERKMRVF